ncbi:hypothetical protein OESDEN_08687 [Oesophagostomum dentatum]|uniref:Saposin B-type domain-containing protein n=1 Tax=Oesophagostomum dentatum TaxID=61180 RepID=A0A0B1T6M3_OESDE|nr:hypothetical protein OESDEN_08687 [Oesophagostomum dentatum]
MHLFWLVILVLYAAPIFCVEELEEEEEDNEDLSALPTVTLTPQETCELCQIALRTVYGHFGANIPSRRKLVHQLKHECKRHFNYRRRCLLLMKVNYDMIYQEMTGGSFKPMQACLAMKILVCSLLH